MIVYGISEKGNYREENQDAILMRNSGQNGLFLVADGVGGALHGAEVSRYLVECYEKWWNEQFVQKKNSDFSELFGELKNLAEQTNRDICLKYGTGNSGSTMVLLFLYQGIYGYISVGDSRIYHCSRRGTRKITRDDVWENRPDADAQSPYAGKIISAIGGYECLEYSCATDRIHRNDVFLLCSDGIYRYVEEPFLIRQLKYIRCRLFSRQSAMEQIVARAEEADPKDNYSAIIIRI